MADSGGDYSIPGFGSDFDSADLQRRSPPSSSNSSPSLGNGHLPTHANDTEDEGPVIRVAATRNKKPVAEITGHGNALVMDSRNLMQYLIGRKLARKLHCGSLWLIKDYCGLFCAIMTWGLIFYAEFVMWFIIVPSRAISWPNIFIWQCWASLAFFSHLRAMLSDPGAIPIGNCTMDNLRRLGYCSQRSDENSLADPNYRQAPTIVYKCPRCACIKPDKSHHCSICRRCIFKMDHHCPWVNNCVGMMNQKFFILFTLYICLMSSHAIIIDLQFLFTCFPYIDPHAASRMENEASSELGAAYQAICLRPSRHGGPDEHLIGLSGGIIFVIFMLFEGVIFALFTAIMCGTQIHALCTETSTIESIKKGDAELGQHQDSKPSFSGEPNPRQRRNSGSKHGSCFSPLGEAFGDRNPPNFWWLSPFHHHQLRKPGFLQPVNDDDSSSTAFLSSIRTA